MVHEVLGGICLLLIQTLTLLAVFARRLQHSALEAAAARALLPHCVEEGADLPQQHLAAHVLVRGVVVLVVQQYLSKVDQLEGLL